LVVLYKIAQARGNAMTLRSYILFSDEVKRQYPAWWQEYGELVNGKLGERPGIKRVSQLQAKLLADIAGDRVGFRLEAPA
jgi:hypothetical protein